MKRFIAIAYIFSIAFFSAARADEIQYLQGLSNPDYYRVESETLERPFHIFVRLPEGYNESEKTYPTIYLLDGGINFPLLAPYYLFLSIDEPMPEAIIVGISYGANDFEGGNMRSTDYTAPSPERAYWGGAAQYQTFLSTELLPFIETNYRSDAARRIIYGQSLGGQFVLYTALTNPDLFWGHIANNPALHRNLSFFIEHPLSKNRGKSKLFVSSGSKDDDRFRLPARAWIAHWTSKSKTPWALKTVTLDGESHASAGPLSFRAGMRWLFNSEPSETE